MLVRKRHCKSINTGAALRLSVSNITINPPFGYRLSSPHQLDPISQVPFCSSASKMKSIIAICSLLVASVAAAPLEARDAPSVTFALSNDNSGAYAGVPFAADGTDKTISSLFGTTSVASNGQVWATSAQLTAFPQTISCVLMNNGATLTTFTAWHTYFDLDGNPSAAIPVDLTAAVINCSA